uniref:Uncharacterized protein n=1 Tax=Setaria italica TaxID=4555 RepID=K3ZCK4_SETIT
SLFASAVTTEVGNGANTKFWTDRWLNGCSIEFLAPHLFASVPKRRVKRRTVQETLLNYYWLQDIQGHYSVAVLAEFLDIWDLVQEVVLQPEVEDNSPPNQLMRHSSMEQFLYNRAKLSGALGLQGMAWTLRKMRNDIVFNGVLPRMDQMLLLAQDEADHWMLAGAKGLSGLVAARPGG